MTVCLTPDMLSSSRVIEICCALSSSVKYQTQSLSSAQLNSRRISKADLDNCKQMTVAVFSLNFVDTEVLISYDFHMSQDTVVSLDCLKNVKITLHAAASI